MRAKYLLSHLSDACLLRDLTALVARERPTTALVLAHIAEVDERKLWAPAGYDSMYQYCLHELRFCEEAAYKRIHAARAARRFPAIFDAVGEGRLHLSAVVMLAPHLREENAAGLLADATYKTKSQIQDLIAFRFPGPDVPTRLTPAPAYLQSVTALQHAPGRAETRPAELSGGLTEPPVPGSMQVSEWQAPATEEPSTRRPKVLPLSPGRFLVQFTMDESMRDELRRSQELFSHCIPSGDIVQVIHHALKTANRVYEKKKFAATDKPRSSRGTSENPRYIPAAVKRAVRERDQDQCTFVSETGRR